MHIAVLLYPIFSTESTAVDRKAICVCAVHAMHGMFVFVRVRAPRLVFSSSQSWIISQHSSWFFNFTH